VEGPNAASFVTLDSEINAKVVRRIPSKNIKGRIRLLEAIPDYG
jgi:hypothetical protein